MSARSIKRNRARAEAADQRRNSRRARRASLVAGAAIGATVVFAPSASAATFEVNTLADNGTGGCDTDECTLREAVQAANGNGEDDTITFETDLTGTISLDGQIQIYGNYALDIQGPGADVITVSGSDSSRIFHVDTESPVSISGLTLTDGSADGDNKYSSTGGAIRTEYGSNLALADSVLTGNYAAFAGGGVYNGGGTVTVTSSQISGNSGGFGGGVFSSGAKYDPSNAKAGSTGQIPPGTSSLTITDSEVSENDAFDGGGIFSSAKYSQNGDPAESTLTVSDSTISGNSALIGAGSQSKYSDTEMSGTTIADNVAYDSIGGVGNDGGTLEISNSAITGNYADGGSGGISVGSYGQLKLTDSEVTGNVATGDGGGVSLRGYGDDSENYPGRSSEITRTTISGNEAGYDPQVDNSNNYYGGGIFVGNVRYGDSLSIADTTISGNDVSGDNGQGGGIAFDNAIYGDAELSNSTVSGNTAAFGGGVSIDGAYVPDEPPPEAAGESSSRGEIAEGGSLVLANSTIAANAATQKGGGIYLGSYYAYYDSETDMPVYATSEVPLSSTIVGDNTAAGSPNDLEQNDVTEPGGGFRLTNSLVEVPDGATVTQDPAGSSILGSDPALGGLADNGGPTRTHLPAETSPAIDTGLANGLTTDQRGEARTVDQPAANGAGDGTDIGSVEIQSRPVQSSTRRLNRDEVPGGCGLPFDDAALTLAGDDTSQTITGSEGDDILRGFGGSDTVLGVGGDDCLTGDDDNDTVEGGAGDDFGDGGAGEDLLKGNDGNDELRGADGDDLLKAAAGDDKGVGGGGDDRVVGGAGDDTLRGLFGDDRVSGGNDDDALRGGGGADKVGGGKGDDSIRGGGGDDRISLGSGKDVVNCGKGDDVVTGAGANDDVATNCEVVK